MKTRIEVFYSRDNIQQNIGKYIRFEGHGIIDGLKQPKNKFSFYRIVGFDDEKSLVIKRFRAKRSSYLPVYNQAQEFEIIDKKEFLRLPNY
jgi:hypothetical protein